MYPAVASALLSVAVATEVFSEEIEGVEKRIDGIFEDDEEAEEEEDEAAIDECKGLITEFLEDDRMLREFEKDAHDDPEDVAWAQAQRRRSRHEFEQDYRDCIAELPERERAGAHELLKEARRRTEDIALVRPRGGAEPPLQEDDSELSEAQFWDQWSKTVDNADEIVKQLQEKHDIFVETKKDVGLFDNNDQEYIDLVKKLDGAKNLVKAFVDLTTAIDPKTAVEKRTELFQKYSWKLAKEMLKAAGASTILLKSLEVGWGVGTPIGNYMAEKIEVVADVKARESAMRYVALGGKARDGGYFEYEGHRFYRDHEGSYYVARSEAVDWLAEFGSWGGLRLGEWRTIWKKVAD